MSKLNVLYIHGLGGNTSGSAYSFLKEYFKDDNVFGENFDLTNFDETYSRIKDLVAQHNIDIVYGHSFGGFYALLLQNEDIFTIVSNPCMKPSEEIPRLAKEIGIDIPPDFDEKFKSAESQLYESRVPGMVKQFTYGFFGRNDTLFRFKPLFDSVFGMQARGIPNSSYVDGGHHLVSELRYQGFEAAFNYLDCVSDMIDQVPIAKNLHEGYQNVWTKEAKDKEKMEKYGPEVYDILKDSYASIGGIAGISSLDDLILETDLWKIRTYPDYGVIAVACYTTKRGGRKLVCAGSDGSSEGKKELSNIIAEDSSQIDRAAWAEVSGAMEHLYLKQGAVKLPIDAVKGLMYGKTIYPVTDEDIKHEEEVARLQAEAKGKEFKGLINDLNDGFHYVRVLGDHKRHVKVCVSNIEGVTK